MGVVSLVIVDFEAIALDQLFIELNPCGPWYVIGVIDSGSRKNILNEVIYVGTVGCISQAVIVSELVVQGYPFSTLRRFVGEARDIIERDQNSVRGPRDPALLAEC